MIKIGRDTATSRSLQRTLMSTVGSPGMRALYPGDRDPPICNLRAQFVNIENEADAKDPIGIYGHVPAIIDRGGFDDGWKWRFVPAYRRDSSGVRDDARFYRLDRPCVSATNRDLWGTRS